MHIVLNGRSAPAPDFLIVGAAKAGTTSLYHYLQQHPGIYFPELKEPGFFCHYGSSAEAISALSGKVQIVADPERYADLFARAKAGQKLGDATTDYLYLWQKSIANIRTIYGDRIDDLRILILL